MSQHLVFQNDENGNAIIWRNLTKEQADKVGPMLIMILGAPEKAFGQMTIVQDPESEES